MEVAALDGDVLADVEDDPAKAALRQLAFQATVWIVQPAPMNLPRNLVKHFYLFKSGADVLQVL
jgi:hypothetical protein